MSGRLDLPDKQRDFENVSIAYLGNLYAEIDKLTAEKTKLEEGVGALMYLVAELRMTRSSEGPALGTLHHSKRRLRKLLGWRLEF